MVRAFAHGAMGRRIDPSFGEPIELFLFQPVLHDWCNKGCGMCYPVCGMVHIKEPLLLIVKSTVHTRRYVARVDKSHPLIVLSSQFSVTDPLISHMVDSFAAEVSPSLITDITFSQVIEISTRK